MIVSNDQNQVYPDNIAKRVGKSKNVFCTWVISIIPALVYMILGTVIPTSLNNFCIL